MTSAEDIVKKYEMKENTLEGGFFAPVYTAPLLLPANFGTRTANQQLPICSAIYYLITRENFSVLHRVTSDMLYHFYVGDPVEVLLLGRRGGEPRQRLIALGNDMATAQQPTLVIPAGTWMGLRVSGNGSFALMGVSMAPAFDPANYEIGERRVLLSEFPSHRAVIERYTKG